MKSLKELIRSTGGDNIPSLKRMKLKDGSNRMIPSDNTDYVEQAGDTRTEFDHTHYANPNWNMIRNVKSKKKHDVYRTVAHSSDRRKPTTVDKT